PEYKIRYYILTLIETRYLVPNYRKLGGEKKVRKIGSMPFFLRKSTTFERIIKSVSCYSKTRV
ncbi:unnamed protein product, partial [Hymenolepis diminuta]